MQNQGSWTNNKFTSNKGILILYIFNCFSFYICKNYKAKSRGIDILVGISVAYILIANKKKSCWLIKIDCGVIFKNFKEWKREKKFDENLKEIEKKK